MTRAGRTPLQQTGKPPLPTNAGATGVDNDKGPSPQSGAAERKKGIPPKAKEAQLLELDAWNIARSMIQHEDTLIHHRMTHYLTIQAFLFTVTGLTAREAVSAPDLTIGVGWALGIFLLCVIAFYMGVLAHRSIRAAVVQIVSTRNWWANTSSDTASYNPLWWNFEKNKPTDKTASQLAIGRGEKWDGRFPIIMGLLAFG